MPLFLCDWSILLACMWPYPLLVLCDLIVLWNCQPIAFRIIPWLHRSIFTIFGNVSLFRFFSSQNAINHNTIRTVYFSLLHTKHIMVKHESVVLSARPKHDIWTKSKQGFGAQLLRGGPTPRVGNDTGPREYPTPSEKCYPRQELGNMKTTLSLKLGDLPGSIPLYCWWAFNFLQEPINTR